MLIIISLRFYTVFLLQEEGRRGEKDPYCIFELCSFCICIAFRLKGEGSEGEKALCLYSYYIPNAFCYCGVLTAFVLCS